MPEPSAAYGPELFSLEGRTALVTGAAGGIGQAVCRGLAAAGARIVAADISEEGLRDAAGSLEQGGESCLTLGADVTHPEDRQRLVETAVERFGGIHVLVNGAGITRPAPSADYPDEDWDRTLDVNLTAAFRLSKLVARGTIERRSGSIINIASLGAALGFPRNPAYQAAKAGLRQLTRALATDWARHNIRVNNICPGYVHTAMTHGSFQDPAARAERASRTMLNRWGEPHELVGPVVFLASDAASYVTGVDLYVDGGWSGLGLGAG